MKDRFRKLVCRWFNLVTQEEVDEIARKVQNEKKHRDWMIDRRMRRVGIKGYKEGIFHGL